MIRNLIKGNNPQTLLAFNGLVFAAVLVSPFFMQFTITHVIWTVLSYFCMICLGVSITYHRALTHRALKLHPFVERLFATFASISGTGSPIMWVMTHRQHHRFADKEGDPHPPTGVLKTFFGVYPRVSTRGMRNIVRVKYYAFLHRYYFALISALMILAALISLELLFFVLILPIFFSILASNVLNWYGHTKGKIGYRNYNLFDKSQNNVLCGLLIFGEGWHNNHHRHPGSAKFGLRRYEIDISYLMVKLLEALGLASSVKAAKL